MHGLQQLEVNFFWVDFETLKTWKEPFNQATFFNWDPANNVYINQHPVGPGQAFSISLNAGEVNTSRYNIDNRGSATASLEIVYTQYLQLPS